MYYTVIYVTLPCVLDSNNDVRRPLVEGEVPMFWGVYRRIKAYRSTGVVRSHDSWLFDTCTETDGRLAVTYLQTLADDLDAARRMD